jgi:hypothetical protein
MVRRRLGELPPPTRQRRRSVVRRLRPSDLEANSGTPPPLTRNQAGDVEVEDADAHVLVDRRPFDCHPVLGHDRVAAHGLDGDEQVVVADALDLNVEPVLLDDRREDERDEQPAAGAEGGGEQTEIRAGERADVHGGYYGVARAPDQQSADSSGAKGRAVAWPGMAPADDDDPIDSCWPDLLAVHGVPRGPASAPMPFDDVLGAMNIVRETCRLALEHHDPSPQVSVALALVEQAALVAAQIGTPNEPEGVIERVSHARLTLLGQGGARLRLRDRWAMILLMLRDAAQTLAGADNARRREVAENVADRLVGITGCDGPPDPELVLRAIDVALGPRSRRGPVLMELVTAVGLHPTSTDPESLERSIRSAIANVRGGDERE